MESVAPHNLRLEWARRFTSLLRHHIFHISVDIIFLWEMSPLRESNNMSAV